MSERVGMQMLRERQSPSGSPVHRQSGYNSKERQPWRDPAQKPGRGGFLFTVLRFRHWRAAQDALEAEQIDRLGRVLVVFRPCGRRSVAI
jgi:hypothetical protein